MSTPSENKTAASTTPPVTLLSLPPELRDAIYEFAVWHEENEGNISTVADLWKNPQGDKTRTFRTTLKGQTKIISYCYKDRDRVWRRRPQDFGEKALSGDFGCCDVSAYMKDVGARDKASKPFTGHICNPSCLLQPAITRVNRQVREESLPVFYRCNNFSLEAKNFVFRTRKEVLWEDVLSLPMRWLRSIGDCNLGALHRLHITSHKKVGFLTEGETLRFEFSYERGRHGAHVSVKKAKGWDAETQMDDPQLVDVSDSAKCKETVIKMMETALSLHGIGKVLAVEELFGVKEAVPVPKENPYRHIAAELGYL